MGLDNIVNNKVQAKSVYGELMGIHYDYKSKRGERAMLKEAKRKARLIQRRAKRMSSANPVKEEVKTHDIKKTITLEGSIRVLSKNLDINAKEMEANLLDRTFYITETSFTFMNKNFGNADSIRVFANEKVELLNTSVNSCSVDDPVWQLNANSLTLLETGRNAVRSASRVDPA